MESSCEATNQSGIVLWYACQSSRRIAPMPGLGYREPAPNLFTPTDPANRIKIVKICHQFHTKTGSPRETSELIHRCFGRCGAPINDGAICNRLLVDLRTLCTALTIEAAMTNTCMDPLWNKRCLHEAYCASDSISTNQLPPQMNHCNC